MPTTEQKQAAAEARVRDTDALVELVEELAQLPENPASVETVEAWAHVWSAVATVRALRRRSEGSERARAIAANPYACWCPDKTPRPDGRWAPAPDCPIHNGPCECGAPRLPDGRLSCAR